MRRRSFRLSPRRGGSSKRKVVWSRATFQLQTTVAAPVAAINILAPFETDLGAQVIGATVARVRLQGFVFSNEVAGTLTTPAAGLLRTTQTEILASSNPAVSPGRHQDWFYFNAPALDGGFAVAPLDNINFHRFEHDVKSMRKIDELGDTIFFVAGQDPANAGEKTWRVQTSMLIMLP